MKTFEELQADYSFCSGRIDAIQNMIVQLQIEFTNELNWMESINQALMDLPGNDELIIDPESKVFRTMEGGTDGG